MTARSLSTAWKRTELQRRKDQSGPRHFNAGKEKNMATTRKALKSKKTNAPLNQVTIFINVDDEANRADLFDEYVTEAQLHRFFKLVENIGPLPKPPRQKPGPPDPPRDHVREFVDNIWWVLESPACPVDLHNLIADYLTDMGQSVLVADYDGRKTQATDPLHIRLLSKWLPLALEAIDTQAPEHTLDPAKELAKNIAAAIQNPAIPTLLENAIGQGLTEIENASECFGDSATDDIKRWLPLAIAKLNNNEASA
jgi:hypothetical protein